MARGSVMVTVLIAMSVVTSSAASAANVNLSRTKRQLTFENGLRVTDLWLKLLFDWFPNLFPGQLMSTPLLFLPQVSLSPYHGTVRKNKNFSPFQIFLWIQKEQDKCHWSSFINVSKIRYLNPFYENLFKFTNIKLISQNIWQAEKFIDFRTVYSYHLTWLIFFMKRIPKILMV